MSLIPVSNAEMKLLSMAVREHIDSWVRTCVEGVQVDPGEYASDAERRACDLLRGALSDPEVLAAFKQVVHYTCIGLMHSVFTMVDEGIDRDDGEPLYLDIVERDTCKSVITWSAHEEFFATMPEGYNPFG